MPDYRAMARAAAVRNGIDPNRFVAQINAESGFNPNAGSSAGAIGIAQIMPGTAKAWGVDPRNPSQALDAAAKNMARMLKKYNGSWPLALAGYNAGEGAVARYKGVPPFAETKAYIAKIMKGDATQGLGITVDSNAGTKGPGGVAGVVNDVAGAAEDAATAPVKLVAGGIAPIGHFFANLVEPAFWLRVGKVLLGILLLVVALRRLA